jgi:pSer/pThr/pTyr-binding forkhead associated (FHA) protein
MSGLGPILAALRLRRHGQAGNGLNLLPAGLAPYSRVCHSASKYTWDRGAIAKGSELLDGRHCHFRRLGRRTCGPNMQMMLPLAEIVSLLQQSVGNLLRQTGLATAKMLNTETRTQTTVFARSALLFNNELLAKPMTPRKEHEPALSPPRLRVRIGTTPGDQQDLHFGKSFRIGRVEECDVCIKDEYVSRAHAEVLFENGQWWVRDLHSSNGIYIEDQRVELAPVGQSLTMRLGIYGPVVSFEVEPPPPQLKPPITSDTMVARYVERYFAKSAGDETVGEHTRMVRRAYAQVQTKQKWKYGRIMAALVLGL